MSQSFTCPLCGMTSHHPVDTQEGYCGNCHDFTGEQAGSDRFVFGADQRCTCPQVAGEDVNADCPVHGLK